MIKDKGFSLVELLVTVSIVGLLASISISVFSEYRVSAYYAQAQVMARDSLTAMQVQFVDDPNIGYRELILFGGGGVEDPWGTGLASWPIERKLGYVYWLWIYGDSYADIALRGVASSIVCSCQAQIDNYVLCSMCSTLNGKCAKMTSSTLGLTDYDDFCTR